MVGTDNEKGYLERLEATKQRFEKISKRRFLNLLLKT